MGLRRRTLIITSGLLGAAAGVGGWGLLADLRLVPGRHLVDRALGRCDVPAPTEAEPGRVISSFFYSAHRRRTVRYVLIYPPKVAAGARLPVCLVLHGYAATAQSAVDELGYHRLLAAAVQSRTPPFVLAAVDGGDRYWHPRADGDDPLGMLLWDFPIVLAQHGLPVNTFAALGWSMGGYGALVAAAQAPDRIVAVAATAPALWGSFEDASPGAFDSAEDWRTWGDPATLASRVAKAHLRIDCGESDEFASAVADFRDRLADPAVVHFSKGCHDAAFWRSVAIEQLKMIGTALTPPKTNA